MEILFLRRARAMKEESESDANVWHSPYVDEIECPDWMEGEPKDPVLTWPRMIFLLGMKVAAVVFFGVFLFVPFFVPFLFLATLYGWPPNVSRVSGESDISIFFSLGGTFPFSSFLTISFVRCDFVALERVDRKESPASHRTLHLDASTQSDVLNPLHHWTLFGGTVPWVLLAAG
jgi:hypothetical protein